jgi:hypothetical protein
MKTPQFKTPIIGVPGLTGLYGCDCHCFDSIEQLHFFEKQKLARGTIVKIRCSGKFAFVRAPIPGTRFYEYDIMPCKYARDIQEDHAQNLIPEHLFSDTDKQELRIALKKVADSKIAEYRQTSFQELFK